MVANVNALRLAPGKSTLGYLNLALYANSGAFIKDISSESTASN
jgi:hypothetical protein